MTNTWPIQCTWGRGELSPRLHARSDIEHWKMGCAELVNWVTMRQGGIRRRPGTEDMGPLALTNVLAPVRNVPFVFSRDQSYVIELGHLYARFWDPVNGLVLNGDGTAYELETPWFGADLDDLHFAQSADVMTFTHGQYPPVELRRHGATDWRVRRAPIQDGPWGEFTRGKSVLTPGGTGDVCLGGTAFSPNGGSPGNAFDGNDATFWEANTTGAASLEYRFAAPIVVSGYSLLSADDTPPDINNPQAGRIGGFSAPRTWTFEGWDGARWVVLNQQAGETGWGPSERRYYEFTNEGAYLWYRIVVTERNDSLDQKQAVRIKTLQMTGWGDDAGQLVLTLSNASEVNAGQGFLQADVGRQVRLFSDAAYWHWMEVVRVNSATSVQVAARGRTLPNTKPIGLFRMGAFGLQPGYPKRVGFFQQRLALAATDEKPQTLYMSKTGDYPDFGNSSPALPEDGIEFTITDLGEIAFLAESQELLVGTIAAARVFGSSDKNQGFSATNFTQTKVQSYPFAPVQPILAGDAAIAVARNRQALRQFSFDITQGKYTAEDITVLSEHIYRRGVRQLAWQADPNALLWVLLADGTLACVTFEPDQRMVSMSRHELGGGAFVESVCAIPGLGRDELWLAVRRTVDGVPVRRMERLSGDFEGDTQAPAQAVYLDGARRYQGPPVEGVTGLAHMAGLDVQVLADGAEEARLPDGMAPSDTAPGLVPTTVRVEGDALLLPSGKAASVVTVGYPYASRMTSLRASTGQDGALFGRHVRLHNVILDLLDAKGLWLRTGYGQDVELLLRDMDDPMDEAPPLVIGAAPLTYVDDSWRGAGQLTIVNCSAFPSTVRAMILDIESEGPEQGVR